MSENVNEVTETTEPPAISAYALWEELDTLVDEDDVKPETPLIVMDENGGTYEATVIVKDDSDGSILISVREV